MTAQVGVRHWEKKIIEEKNKVEILNDEAQDLEKEFEVPSLSSH